MLDTLADLTSFLVAGKLRKFIHAALASAIMWHPERVKLGEDATHYLCDSYITTVITGFNVHATITMHTVHLRCKFDIDNLHIASAPSGMLGATRMPGLLRWRCTRSRILSAVQNLGCIWCRLSTQT